MKRLLLLSAFLCACVPDNGPTMRPGEDCLFCHSSAGGATPWSAAGTVFASADGGEGFEGAQVQITDAKGFSVSLRTNLSGNFYTRESLQFPLQPCIVANGKTVCQKSAVQAGSCNTCHGEAIFGATEPQLTPP